MAFKDTLQLYDELIAGGCTENQARAQAKQLGELGTCVSNQLRESSESVKNALDGVMQAIGRIDKELITLQKDQKWMYILGAAMMVALFSNIIFSH